MIVRQYAPCSLGRSIICLGKQGEINALRVEFDVSAWMAMYPDATVKLMHFAPDRPQDNPVIPTLGVEGTLRVWIVGEEDTAGAGNGVIELLLIDERTGSTIKSATGYTTVLRSPSAGIEAQEAEAGYVRYDVDQSALLTDEQKAVARKNIGAGTGDDPGSGGILKETDPTVPDWAKQPSKPTYTASEVGALPSSYTPPVTSVNGKTGAVALSAQDVGARPDTWTPSASDVGADAAGTASGAVAAHNTSGAAHADLRALIEGLTSRLNALADSDDTTLDQLSEIVAYIKSNKALIDAVTTGKVSVSDIVDNLTTNASGKVLSAAQGVALKAMIDGIVIPTTLPNPQPITINGQRYDGSEAVEVSVSAGGGSTVELDTTLTQSGKAADAKAVGDQLSALNEANAKQDTEINALKQASGIVTVEPADDDIPKIYFTGTTPTSKGHGDVQLFMRYVSKTARIEKPVTLKVQGDSSANYPKKNFTMKVFADSTYAGKEKLTFKGWPAMDKFVLKAHWMDHSHVRNVGTAKIWGKIVASRSDYASLPEELRMAANNGATDGFTCKVFVNGVYQGLYELIVPKDKLFGQTTGVPTHSIINSEQNNQVSCAFATTSPTVSGNWSEELQDSMSADISTSFANLIKFVAGSTDEEFVANAETYFDVQSVIDFDIFARIFCIVDNVCKNQIFFTYDGMKWYEGAWDMDGVLGNPPTVRGYFAYDTAFQTGYVAYKDHRITNLLYERVETLFMDRFKARYAELRADILSADNIVDVYERLTDVITTYEGLLEEDYASTTGGGAFTDMPYKTENNIQQIRNFVAARLPYMDEQVAAIRLQIPCTGISLDQTTLTFTEAGTQTLIATVTPSDTTDAVLWSSDDPSIASVRNGVVMAKANGSATITATCGAYSATCAVSVSGIVGGETTDPIGVENCVLHLDAIDRGEGTTWNDISGNSNNATLVRFPTETTWVDKGLKIAGNNASDRTQQTTFEAGYIQYSIAEYSNFTLFATYTTNELNHLNYTDFDNGKIVAGDNFTIDITKSAGGGKHVLGATHKMVKDIKSTLNVEDKTFYVAVVKTDGSALGFMLNDGTYRESKSGFKLQLNTSGVFGIDALNNITLHNVIVYDRVLTDEEISTVKTYCQTRYGS